MEKAIEKLKFEIGVIENLHCDNKELNSRVGSYKKAVEILEAWESARMPKTKLPK